MYLNEYVSLDGEFEWIIMYLNEYVSLDGEFE